MTAGAHRAGADVAPLPALLTITEHGAPPVATFHGTDRDPGQRPPERVAISAIGNGWHVLVSLTGAWALEVSPARRVWLTP